MEKKNGIGARLARVLAQVKRVPKNGRNMHFKYDYATEADLMDFLRPMLAEEGLFILPAVTSLEKNGTKTIIKMEFTIIDDGGESLGPFSWYGEADDKQDKGLYKAITGGTKYFLFKTFMVSTGDDPEANTGDAPAPTSRPSAPQPPKDAPQPSTSAVELYRQYLELLGNSPHAVSAMKKTTGKTDSKDYTEDDFRALREDLNRRKRAS